MVLRRLVAAAVLVVPNLGAAQAVQQREAPDAARLVGRVLDETHRPVEGVDVIVDRREVRAVTDAFGVFRLDVSRADSTVGFRRIGYRPMLLTIHPLPPLRDTILVQLVTSPVHLPEVIVSGSPSKPLRYAGTTKYDEVFLRRKVGLGTLIPREAIEQRFGVATHELLKGVPGVRTWNGPPKRIRFARCQDPAAVSLFVDGVRQVVPGSGSAGGAVSLSGTGRIMLARPRASSADQPGLTRDEPLVEVLSDINPTDIEMIEVYGGASEIPGVFHWDGCAVIAIWTRWNK